MLLVFEEIAISQKLEDCRANQVQIRNQRPRLRTNRLIVGRKAKGRFCKPALKFLQPILTFFEKSPIYYLFWLAKFLT